VSKQWLGKNVTLGEDAISEILVADTDLESGAEASNIKDYFDRRRRRKKRRRMRTRMTMMMMTTKASAEVKPQAAIMAYY
jgi:hypothetical protein